MMKSVKKYLYLLLAIAAGVVATPAVYEAFVFLLGAAGGAYLWLALDVVFPTTILMGGFVTGMLLRKVSPALRTGMLLVFTPGIYQVLLSIITSTLQDLVPADTVIEVLCVAVHIPLLSFCGLMCGYHLLRRDR